MPQHARLIATHSEAATLLQYIVCIELCSDRSSPCTLSHLHTFINKHAIVRYAAGCGGHKEPEPVEYDLDNEDEDWLATYNLGRTRISDVLFERMLWKLELECAAATEHALTAAGELALDA
jgi:hypothetical protein